MIEIQCNLLSAFVFSVLRFLALGEIIFLALTFRGSDPDPNNAVQQATLETEQPYNNRQDFFNEDLRPFAALFQTFLYVLP